MTSVTLIATGGTIASAQNKDAVTAGIEGKTLLQGVTIPAPDITVQVQEFKASGSYALDLSTVFRLCRTIEEALSDPSTDGVVVTHGTDTMEESAFLAWLMVRSEKPVVFTGAQRHAGLADTDGPRNISDAISAAASSALTGIGPVIVFEGDIHAARYVTKAHTSRVDAFRSIGLGKLGEVDQGRVCVYQRPAHRPPKIQTKRLEPEVELIGLGLGSSPKMVTLAAEHGTRGFVLAAFGRGNAPNGFAEEIARLSERNIPVVVASRCHEGRTQPIYGNDSGGATLAKNGAIFAGDYSPVKARLLLSAGLGAGYSKEEIASLFEL